MKKVLRCECGFEVHADGEARLVAEVRRHALEEHGMQLSRGDVLQLARRSDLGAGTRPTRPGDERHEGAS